MPRKNRRPRRRSNPPAAVCYAQRRDIRTACARLTAGARTSNRWEDVTCDQCKAGD